MRDILNILDNLLLERGVTGTAVSKDTLKDILRKQGYNDFKDAGNKLQVLVQIPDGAKKEEFRAKILNEILALFKQTIPKIGRAHV